jgi:hypothetical protein
MAVIATRVERGKGCEELARDPDMYTCTCVVHMCSHHAQQQDDSKMNVASCEDPNS